LKKWANYDTISINSENEVSVMLMRQELIQRFLWGTSILNSCISFNNQLNYHDINIFSKNFMRDKKVKKHTERLTSNIAPDINIESETREPVMRP